MFGREPKKYIRCPKCFNPSGGEVGCKDCDYKGYGTNINWIIWDLNRQHKEQRKLEKLKNYCNEK